MLGLGSGPPRAWARPLSIVQPSFHGLVNSFQRLCISQPAVQSPPRGLVVVASRRCDLTGKKANNGYRITFSHKRNHHRQNPNLQKRMLYWPEGQRWVRLKVCTRALKTIDKKGLQAMADEAGINLWKLPFRDARPERLQWLEENPHYPPMAKNRRVMKNPERLAESGKTPLVARYLYGKIVYVHEGTDLDTL